MVRLPKALQFVFLTIQQYMNWERRKLHCFNFVKDTMLLCFGRKEMFSIIIKMIGNTIFENRRDMVQ